MKRKNKKVYIPYWNCKYNIVGCPINNNEVMNIEICNKCPYNIPTIEIQDYKNWMDKYIGDTIFWSKKVAQLNIERTEKNNKIGNAILNLGVSKSE